MRPPRRRASAGSPRRPPSRTGRVLLRTAGHQRPSWRPTPAPRGSATSTIENPPMTSLVSGERAVGDHPVGGHDARPLAFQSAAVNPHPGVQGLLEPPRSEGLVTAGMSSSGMWSIAWAPNEIRYRVIPCLPCLPSGSSGRLSPLRRTARLRIRHSASINTGPGKGSLPNYRVVFIPDCLGSSESTLAPSRRAVARGKRSVSRLLKGSPL